jgi:hypothetical protein
MNIKFARRSGMLACAATALLLVACGGEKTDVSAGVKSFNDDILAQQGAQLDCPKTIDGGEGATFDCTLKSADGGNEETVTLKVVKQGDKLAVDVEDSEAFNQALQSVTGG